MLRLTKTASTKPETATENKSNPEPERPESERRRGPRGCRPHNLMNLYPTPRTVSIRSDGHRRSLSESPRIFPAQALDEHVHQVRVWVKVISPHVLDYLGAREDASGRAHQVFEQAELAGREPDDAIPPLYLTRDQVHRKIPRLQHAQLIPRGPPHDRMNSRNEFLHIKWLRQVIVRAEIEALNTLVQFAFGPSTRLREPRFSVSGGF